MRARRLIRVPHYVVSQMKERIVAGHLQEDIAREMGTSQATVSMIKLGKRYSEIFWPNGREGGYESAYGTHPESQLVEMMSCWQQYILMADRR